MEQVERRPIELGVILAGPLEAVDREAIDAAVTEARNHLTKRLPEFHWICQLAHRDEWTEGCPIEPTDLLQQAREERDERGWDLAFVLTAADLISHYKPFALGIISRALDVAIISTARVDPRAFGPGTQDADRAERIKQCVLRLMMHTLGHWVGLGHDPDEDNAMHDIDSLEALPGGIEFSGQQCSEMRQALSDIADLRLEERPDLHRAWSVKFFLLAAFENRSEILDAVVQAKPWEFPTRLSRLTTAAVSTIVVLLMTAEAWDMAMNQKSSMVFGLFAFAITTTTAYVVIRQQLVIRRSGRRISEQIVTSNVAAAAIVASGMFAMFIVLCVLCFTAAILLFPPPVVNGWAASLEEPIGVAHYFLLAGTISSLGILIGALGASFEQQHHFRHVVFVDEEV